MALLYPQTRCHVMSISISFVVMPRARNTYRDTFNMHYYVVVCSLFCGFLSDLTTSKIEVDRIDRADVVKKALV